ncbi:hypothetical protein E2C01_045758 [Portunus trituberculatus]|uniref:Uncharacterized protein n=1 Tax=Portunus trituberculatus TaxID=210409 RepID=A0A5B7FWL9_PORTR|nr:hypothetical protein [Portunus trituberculatus]
MSLYVQHGEQHSQSVRQTRLAGRHLAEHTPCCCLITPATTTTTTSQSCATLCLTWLVLMLHRCRHVECRALALEVDKSFRVVT